MCVFARLGHHTFVACQQIHIVRLEQVGAEEQPEHRRPRNERAKETLHRAIAATQTAPAGDAKHRHTSAHRKNPQHDATQLTNTRGGQRRRQTNQKRQQFGHGGVLSGTRFDGKHPKTL